MHKGYVIFSTLVVGIFIIAAGSFFLPKEIWYELIIPQREHDNNLVITEYFCNQFKPFAGEWGEETCEKNVITNNGLDHLERMLGSPGANSPVQNLALGNGTAPIASDTTLNIEQTDCGLGRVVGTYYDLGVGWWEINTTYTYSCGVSRMSSLAMFGVTAGRNW